MKQKKLYQIKPLQWKGDQPLKEHDHIIAHPIPGHFYEIVLWRDEDENGPFPYLCYDEHYERCADIEEGKRKAEKHWRRLIEPGLIEVDGPGNL